MVDKVEVDEVDEVEVDCWTVDGELGGGVVSHEANLVQCLATIKPPVNIDIQLTVLLVRCEQAFRDGRY